MKLSAVIVAYFPNLEELTKNVRACIEDIDSLVIWQNSKIPSQIVDALMLEFSEHVEKISFLGNGKNVGIATALNGAVQFAINNRSSHLLTLDQDSYFAKDSLKIYKASIESVEDLDIGVFGINPEGNGKLLFSKKLGFKDVPDTITSGSIFPLTVFEKCGLFEDSLFIDAVDYEFCYRLKEKYKLRTVVVCPIILHHKVGYPTKRRWSIPRENYSAFRTYFIVRNHIVMWKRYPKSFPLTHKITLLRAHIIFRLFKVVLFEGGKLKKITAIFSGIFNGLSGDVKMPTSIKF